MRSTSENGSSAMGMLTVVAVIWLVALMKCDNPTPKAPPPPGSWLVLLCKAADASQEPQPKSFYKDLFSKGQRDLLFDYFDNASNHTVDVSGTEVYGWFPMTVNTADIAPNVRNNSMPVNRTQTARDCRASALGGITATGISVDPKDYAGIITVINVPVDSGDAGEKSVVLSRQAEDEVGFVAHEMLHVLGLDHSWRASQDGSSDHAWQHGGDVEYEDCSDMMSYRTCVYRFQTVRGPQGPELQGAYREKLGWLPSNRIQVVSGYPPGTTTIILAPVSDPSQPGALLAKIEVFNRLNSGRYVVEYRERSGFDRRLPYNAVMVREQRDRGIPNRGITYLVTRQDGTTAWRKGDTFTDNGNHLSISVDDIFAGGARITVNTKYSSTPIRLGDWCGDRDRGDVLPCPAGTECRRERLPSGLVTSDSFCQ